MAKLNSEPRSAGLEGLGKMAYRSMHRDTVDMVLTWSRKTTIAIEFCHRRQKVQPQAHIFWMQSESYDSFTSSCLELGREAGIIADRGAGNMADRTDEKEHLNRVREWLDNSSSGDWLMVLDNFDNLAVHDDTGLRVAKHLPVKRGRLLYTTRDASILGNFVPPNSGVFVPAMSDEEALQMFSNLLGIEETAAPDNADGAPELLDQLDNLPLAIAQAAAYIRETKVDISSYMRMFKECERNQHDLLNEALPVEDGHGNRYCSRAVTTTWKLTFDKIRERSPDSAQLLEVMSFLNPDDLPKTLLRSAPFLRGLSDVLFHKTFAPLLNFSLIYPLKSSHYRLHRLVGLCIRMQMESEDIHRRNKLLETVWSFLRHGVQIDRGSNYMQCVQLVPHAITALQHATKGSQAVKDGLYLQNFLGEILSRGGDTTNSLVWLQRALGGYEKVLGKDHPNTLGTVHNIAITFQSRGEHDKAMVWFQRALEGYEKVLGKDHPNTLGTVHNMAITFRTRGELDKAMVWFQRALEGHEKVLGKDHPDTLKTVHSMAITFQSRGGHDKAMVWLQRALEGREKVLGKDHPDTLGTVHNIAITFQSRGGHDKAMVWFQRALEGYEKVLGKDHPDTLGTVHNIAITFESRGEHDKAMVWFQRALEGGEKVLGKDHPDTLGAVHNIATCYT